MSMEIGESRCSSGYGKPPWIFKGSALYQFHLVKAETARAFIPKELRLVEAFGYTLGGFFLANYEDSPAGVFDELVVIPGIVWNPPTSCAWAGRVLVNSDEACNHGRKDVGLPSQVASFSKRVAAVPMQSQSKFKGFLNRIGVGRSHCHRRTYIDVQVTESEDLATKDICTIKLATDVPTLNFDNWMGPSVKMPLPSFSGLTKYNPNLLKYSCQIQCRVRPVPPAEVLGPSPSSKDNENQPSGHTCSTIDTTQELVDYKRDLCISVMLSKPILALQFKCLKMRVEAPVVISHCSKSSLDVT